MTNEEIEQNIRVGLRNRFPNTVFQVSYANSSLDLQFMGGSREKDTFPITEEAVREIEQVVRQTIPDFCVERWW